jgi:aldehyde dehydrogenase (NAD+)
MSEATALAARTDLLIGGRWATDPNRGSIEVENPSTQEIIARIPQATRADVDRAVDMAVELHRSEAWSRTSLSERAELLNAIADEIDRRAPEIQELYVKDQGGVAAFAAFPPMAAAMAFRDNAQLASSLDLGLTRRDTSGGSVYLSREPVGPVATIVPWNAPMLLAPVKIAPALLAGCPVIVKISPETPLGPLVLAEVFAEVGVPEGLISFLPGGKALGQYLISRPGIAHISFTGSTAAGQQVMKTAAEHMARLTLELGGKSAALVLDDADPAEFAPVLAAGSVVQSGQVCTTQSRILVPEARKAEWVAALTREFESLKVGDPADPGTQVGPLVSQAQVERVESYVQGARQEGATVLAGGTRPQGSEFEAGHWFLPTLVTDTRPDMKIYREEVFGPVIVIEGYEDLDAGIAAANDSDYGLGAGVYTPDIDRAVELALRIESGTVSINSSGPSFTAPFGGVKMSGFGREGGIEGVEAMLETKQIKLP